jgi:nicotinate-nucleotide adenylyltransferase
VIALFGGAFDPPHVGHVALADAALRAFAPEELVVLVAEDPWHKEVPTPVEARVELVRAAFPSARVEVDPYEATVDLLEARRWHDPLFLIGADQLAAFLTWRRPERVLELARLGVATRPGFDRRALDDVLVQVLRPERVLFFELDPVRVSSTEIRDRVLRGEPLDGLVPLPVADRIHDLGLYRAR